MNPEQRTLRGEDKERYLALLDAALAALAAHLRTYQEGEELAPVRDLGRREGWDWRRLPPRAGLYQALAAQVERVRREYDWFAWRRAEPVQRSRGHDEELAVDAGSGLPWAFELIRLHQLRRDAPQLLGAMQSPGDAAVSLRRLLTGDEHDPGEVERRAGALHREAMRRSFLQQLSRAELLQWRAGQQDEAPEARLLLDLGAEQLWRITSLRYLPERSLFACHVIDMWQDLRQPLLAAREGAAEVPQALTEALRLGADNEAWYILASLDRRFSSLHPVHASRGLIGPLYHSFAGATGTAEVPSAVRRILAGEQGTGLLRFTRQYAYAPNHDLRDGEVRQIVHREDWRDEVLVCPARHSAGLERSLGGARLRVVEV